VNELYEKGNRQPQDNIACFDLSNLSAMSGTGHSIIRGGSVVSKDWDKDRIETG
jgi:hypothetical protein